MHPLESAERVDVLGVGVDPLTVEELETEVRRLARGAERAVVLNVNAHCLNLAYRDASLRDYFDRADVVFCDGFGVKLAAWLLGCWIPARITYADWMWRLAALAAREGFSVYFLGARPGVARRAADRLVARYPGLVVSGAHHGYFDHRTGTPENEAIVEGINAAVPDILVVGFGMPLQERWLMENRHRLNAKVALTGGAAFDYVAGNLRRGPRLLTDNGLEWLTRLLIEPRRLWRRYLIGNPLLLARVLRQRFSKRHARSR
ncbi:MAG TPA: WecB/TagA/CpsF family glycosyltransferase [Rubrobacteraceae bacterium]|nr:WecB/TagA/CpsF family glycosyltransferase [Rubrobacteraceae bacterium]